MRFLAFNRFEKFLVILIALGLIGAIYAAWFRHTHESANRTVEVILDGREVLALASASGMPPEVIAEELKKAGATSLAANELSLQELIENGDVSLSAMGRGKTLVTVSDPALAVSLRDALVARMPGMTFSGRPSLSKWSTLGGWAAAVIAARQRQPEAPRGDVQFIADGNLAAIMGIGLLLDPQQIAIAKSAGLSLVVRLENSPFAQQRAIDYALNSAHQAGAHMVIFDGDAVLGYKGLMKYTADEMQRLALSFGWIELVPQYGADAMNSRLYTDVIRVHGVPEREMPKLSPATVQDRFVRGARERNIRAVYARLFLQPQENVLAYNADYLGGLTTALQHGGLRLGTAQPYAAASISQWAQLLLALGTAAVVTLLASRALPLAQAGQIACFALLCLFMGLVQIVFASRSPLLARQLWALLAGLSFPTLALLLTWQALRARVDNEVVGEEVNALTLPPSHAPLFMSSVLVVFICLFSLAGGLYVSGLLTDTRFMVGAEQFRGVKLLLVGPAFLMALIVLGGLSRAYRRPSEWAAQYGSAARAFLARPTLIIELILFFVALAAVAFMLIRSGNAAPGAAPGVEGALRQHLEDLLWARPRTKEFLFAHPLLMLWLFLWLRLRRRPASPCMPFGRLGAEDLLPIVAAIGQANIIDTFCHIHTPIVFSIVRTLHGIWLGVICGFILIALWLLIERLFHFRAEGICVPENILG